MKKQKTEGPYNGGMKLLTDQQLFIRQSPDTVLLDELRRRGAALRDLIKKCTDEELFSEVQSRGYSGQIAKIINLDKEHPHILPGF